MREFDRHTRIAELELTDIQKAFAESYVQHFNISRAVRESGSKSRNLGQTGNDLIKNPRVQAYISILKEDAAGRVDLRLDRVLKELMRIGFARIDDYVDWDNETITIKDSNLLTEDMKAAVQEVVQEDTKYGTRIKVKLHAKQPALDKLLNYVQDQEGGKKKDDAPKKVVINNVTVRQSLEDPVARKAIETLANQFFRSRGKATVPEINPAMRRRIKEITESHLVEYMPPESPALPVDTETGDADNK